MSAQLVKMLKGRIDHDAVVDYVATSSKAYLFLVTLMQKEEKPAYWRADWIVNHLI